MRRKKIELLHKRETIAIGKSFMQNQIKNGKYFEGDIIFFLKNDGALASTYQFGKIKEIERSQDNRIRKVTITYRNHNESINRETRHAVRHIVIIHPVDETSIVTELVEIATTTNISHKISSKC